MQGDAGWASSSGGTGGGSSLAWTWQPAAAISTSSTCQLHAVGPQYKQPNLCLPVLRGCVTPGKQQQTAAAATNQPTRRLLLRCHPAPPLQGSHLQGGKKEAHGIIKGPSSSGGSAGGGGFSGPSSTSAAATAATSAPGGGSGSVEERGEQMADLEILRETAQ